MFSIALKMILALPLLIFVRGLDNDQEDGRQPAKLQYFSRQSYLDIRSLVVWSMATANEWLVMADAGLRPLYRGIQLVITWPVLLIGGVAFLIATSVATAAYIGVVLLQVLALAVVMLFFWYGALSLHVLERSIVLARRGHAKCPHAGCHARVSVPIHLCPECGAKHTRLVPGRHGALWRRCTCKRAYLETLSWYRSDRIVTLCATCKQPMQGQLFASNVHIPIYGGPSVGKTMFMMTSAWQLIEGRHEDVFACLIDDVQRKNYINSWQPDLKRGRLMAKTVDTLPKAFLLSMRHVKGLPVSLYLYDPAGEALKNEDDLRAHRFLRYFDGMALLLDPVTLERMADQYRKSTKQDVPATTSQLEPFEMVHRVVDALEHLAKLSRGRQFHRRLAVVFTKCDLPVVRNEWNLEFDDQVPVGPWEDLGFHRSQQLRGWLAKYEPGLLNALENRFSDIRFFAVSAMGPPGSKEFRPQKVLEPLLWLLSKRYSLRKPLHAKILGRSAEAAAATVAACFLVGVPLLLGTLSTMEFLRSHPAPARPKTAFAAAPAETSHANSGNAPARSRVDRAARVSRIHIPQPIATGPTSALLEAMEPDPEPPANPKADVLESTPTSDSPPGPVTAPENTLAPALDEPSIDLANTRWQVRDDFGRTLNLMFKTRIVEMKDNAGKYWSTGKWRYSKNDLRIELVNGDRYTAKVRNGQLDGLAEDNTGRTWNWFGIPQ